MSAEKKSGGISRIEKIIVQKRDESLVKSTLAGDSKSFTKLMRLYMKRVTAIGMNFFKNQTECDDFVQDVFIKAYTGLKNFKGASSFSTWLVKIAYTTAVNAFNKNKKFLPLADEELLVSKDFTPEEEQIQRLTIQAVRESVKNLPENYSVCIELYFFHDFSYEEIAEITGFPMNTLKSHIFRAKKLLREKLRSYYEH